MAKTPEEKLARRGGKYVLGFLVYLITTCVVLGAIGFWWAAKQYKSEGPLTEEKLVTIERGSGLNQIAYQLEEAGAVNNRYIFILGARVTGAAQDLKAGEYELEPGISPSAIIAKLRSHDVFGRRITIREGLTSYEVIRLLNEVDVLSGEVDIIPPEGSLLPNTYDYRLEEPRDAIVQRLNSEMVSIIISLCSIKALDKSTWETILIQPCANGYLKTVREVLTLASIIEKETSVSEERRKVAGVFINRLKRGIPLQTDPTVIYAITKGKHKNDGKGPLGRRLLRKDLDYDSPYNTYKYPGLPPGPIANPGKASIEAALDPEEHDYIFFVADGTGGHAFAKTLTEHNRNVAQWRKIRRSQ